MKERSDIGISAYRKEGFLRAYECWSFRACVMGCLVHVEHVGDVKSEVEEELKR